MRKRVCAGPCTSVLRTAVPGFAALMRADRRGADRVTRSARDGRSLSRDGEGRAARTLGARSAGSGELDSPCGALMAISTASPFLPEPPRASRSQYQRARDLLPYAWPSLREAHDLRPIDFQLLTVVLVNQPGRLFRQKGSRPTNDGRRCKRETMGFADWLGISRTSANESINRLNEAGLLWGLMYEQGDELPFGTREPARTNIIEYRVNVAIIERHYDADAFKGSRPRRPPTGSDPGPSDGPDPGPSSKLPRSEQPSTPKPPSLPRASRKPRVRAATPPEDEKADTAPTAPPEELTTRAVRAGDDEASETPRDVLGASGESVEASPPTSEGEQRGKAEQAAGHESALFAQWDALKLPEKGGTLSRLWRPNERTTIRKRLADCGADRVRLAILGAGADKFLRAGLALCAVAVVFGRREKTLEFARAGERIDRERWAVRLRDRAQVLQAKAMREGAWLSDHDARLLAREQIGSEPWRHAPANDVGGEP
jgi:hypothetical protein